MAIDEGIVQIDGFPDYAITDNGAVLSLKTGRSIMLHDNGGYLRVSLSLFGKGYKFYVHQLVAKHFLEGWRPRMQVKHLDGDRHNNHIDNLEIRGPREGTGRYITSRPITGRRVRIKETGETYMNTLVCAKAIGGDQSHIYACLRGERDTHLGYSYEYVVVPYDY